MFRTFNNLLSRFRGDRSGATATEYALVAGALAITIVASVRVSGLEAQKPFVDVATELSTVQP